MFPRLKQGADKAARADGADKAAARLSSRRRTAALPIASFQLAGSANDSDRCRRAGSLSEHVTPPAFRRRRCVERQHTHTALPRCFLVKTAIPQSILQNPINSDKDRKNVRLATRCSILVLQNPNKTGLNVALGRNEDAERSDTPRLQRTAWSAPWRCSSAPCSGPCLLYTSDAADE